MQIKVIENIIISTCVTRTSLENCDDSTETLGSLTAASPIERKQLNQNNFFGLVYKFTSKK